MKQAYPRFALEELARQTGSRRTPGCDTRIADRYLLQRRLGSGASGVVYEALDEARSGARVALKLLVSQQPGALMRLKNEFRALSRTLHPNLVGLHGLGVDKYGWFLVMDLVDPSTDFVQHARAQGRCDEGRLRAALAQLLHGVSALHGAGKLHRDLKPNNVLVTQEGRVVIVDFGLLGEPDEADGSFVGTPAYASPEQLLGHSLEAKSDLYAVGVMLFESLTGRLPADAPTPEGLLAHKLRDAAALPDHVAGDLRALCCALLAPDPDLRPGADEALARLGETPLPTPRSSSFFVGRERELELLDAAATRTQSEGPILALVLGESGIGKSALSAHFCERARERTGALVLAGRCHPREQVPYKAFDTLVDALASHLQRLPQPEAMSLMPRNVGLLARLFPTLASVPAVMNMPSEAPRERDPALLRARAFLALKELLARIADRQPLLLSLDDLQWSDLDSMELLRELVSGSDAPACLIVGTLRSDHPRPRLLDQTPARLPQLELALGPLERSACLQIADLLGLGIGDRLLDEAAGSPLLLEQLARASQPQGGARTLRSVVLEQLEQLGEPERRLVELVCVAGQPVAVAVLVLAIRAELPALRRGSGCWLLAVRVQQGEEQLEPRHDRLRETVLDLLSPAQRASSHASLAHALALAANPDSEQIAQHFWAAGCFDEAAPHLVHAAERAQGAFAFARAAQLYDQALIHAGEQRDVLELALARALANCGRIAEAALRLERLLARTSDPAQRQALGGEAMVLHVLGGNVEHGARLLDMARRELGEAPLPRSDWRTLAAIGVMTARHLAGPRMASLPVPTRSRHRGVSKQMLELDFRATRGFAQVSPIYGQFFGLRTLLAIRRYRDPERWPVGIAWEVLRRCSFRPQTDSRDEQDMARAINLATQQDDPENLALVWAAEGGRCQLNAEFARAAAAFESSERAMLARGRSVAAVFNGSRAGRIAAWTALGDLASVRAHTPVWRREARAIGDQLGELVVDLMGSYQHLADGDAPRMRDAAEAIDSPLCQQTPLPCDPWWQGDPALYLGDTASAWSAYTKSRSHRFSRVLARVPLHRIALAQYLGRVHLMAAAQGERTRHLYALSSLLGKLQTERHRSATAVLAHLSAGEAWLLGDPQRALRELERAAQAYEELRAGLWAGAMRFHAGQLRGGEQGRAEQGRARDAMRALGVRTPERWFRMMVPGFLALR
jgi:eukaryotic-like serine/threonine-protein kinase